MTIEAEKLNGPQKPQLNIGAVSSSADFKMWDDLFGILAWKFQPTKSGDMFLDAEKVFEELKEKFELKHR
jgi:hypothetical protein